MSCLNCNKLLFHCTNIYCQSCTNEIVKFYQKEKKKYEEKIILLEADNKELRREIRETKI